MHKAFVAFNDRVVASGIQRFNATVAKHLKMTSDRMAELARNGTHLDAEVEDLDQSLSAPMTELKDSPPEEGRSKTPPASNQLPVLGYHTTFDDEEEADDDDGETARQIPAMPTQMQNFPIKEWTSTEAMQQYQIDGSATWKYPIVLSERMQDSQVPALDVSNTSDSDVYTSVQYSMHESEYDGIQDRLPHAAMPPSRTPAPQGRNLYDIISLPMPQSYSSQEASFARRLMRFSVETAYRLVSNPDSRPEDLQRVCRLSWCFTNSPRIASHLKSLTERSAIQNLELWEVPARHVGGAGLHYPRVGIDASSETPEWWASEAPVGPRRLSHPETPLPGSLKVNQIIERAGFGGEWFDSNDVEQYLRSKGLYLDGQSSVVELCEEDPVPALDDTQGPSINSPAVSPSHSSIGAPQSPSNEGLNLVSEPFLQGNDFMWSDETINTPTLPDLDMDFTLGTIGNTDSKNYLPDFDFNLFPNTMPTFNTKIKKFIDVEKFIDSEYDRMENPAPRLIPLQQLCSLQCA